MYAIPYLLVFLWSFERLFLIIRSVSSDNLDDFDWTSLLSIPEENLSPEVEHKHGQSSHDNIHLHPSTSSHVQQAVQGHSYHTNKEDGKLEKAAYFRSYRQRPGIKTRRREQYERSKVVIQNRNRDEYRRRKEKRGYGRIQDTTYSQLRKKVLNNQATEEESKKYLEMKEKKKVYNRTYRQKQQHKDDTKLG